MVTYLWRYMQGDHEQVWAELARLNSSARTGVTTLDALDVARETMQRVHANLQLLVQRLTNRGYRFGYASLESGLCFFLEDQLNPPPALMPPGADIAERLGMFEEWHGPLPLALRAWYETVGAVNLVGALTDGVLNMPFDQFSTSALPALVPGILPDPLWIYPFPTLAELVDHRDAWNIPITRLELAPDAYAKSGEPGGGSVYVSFETQHSKKTHWADVTVMGEHSSASLIRYLREYLTWGGFPGVARLSSLTALHRELAELTEGLIAF